MISDRSGMPHSVLPTWKARIWNAWTAISCRFTAGLSYTKISFVNAGKDNNSPREPSVCHHSTGLITLFAVCNRKFRASRALHVSQLRTRIVVFEDEQLSLTSWGKLQHPCNAHGSRARPMLFALCGDNSTSYRRTIHVNVRLEHCKIYCTHWGHHRLNLTKITFGGTINTIATRCLHSAVAWLQRNDVCSATEPWRR